MTKGEGEGLEQEMYKLRVIEVKPFCFQGCGVLKSSSTLLNVVDKFFVEG